ncbi:MAG: signal peptidase I [Oscillospiraceae bacterium]|nr:signal peptidase I [Oscillospiraceae bacterium]
MTAKSLDEPQPVQAGESGESFVKEVSAGTSRKENSLLKELGALIIKIAVIAAVFTLVFTFLYGLHRSIEPGMAPMVKSGDLVVFYRLDKNYSIGDILLLDFRGERQVRRVVARAGDVVDIVGGGLSINGAVQQEPEIYYSTWAYANGVSFPLTVGEGQVFVLGDARENATDSRVYGSVNAEDTLGTVITIIRRRGL